MGWVKRGNIVLQRTSQGNPCSPLIAAEMAISQVCSGVFPPDRRTTARHRHWVQLDGAQMPHSSLSEQAAMGRTAVEFIMEIQEESAALLKLLSRKH